MVATSMGTLGASMLMMQTWLTTQCQPHCPKVLGKCCWKQHPVVSVERVLMGRGPTVWCVTGAMPHSTCTVHTSHVSPPLTGTARGASPTSLHVGSSAPLRIPCCNVTCWEKGYHQCSWTALGSWQPH